MEATLNPNSSEQSVPMQHPVEKSELMQIFEEQVHDMYWAYKDLLKAIFEKDTTN
jgi:hypothetical protein